MIKLLISLLFFLFIYSCQLTDQNKINKILKETKIEVKQKITNTEIVKKNIKKKNLLKFYIVGDPYFIEGVKYIPQENYLYNEVGLATYYGKDLHNKFTLNNDINKVTELLGRHKTLPLPSIVKITNLENGLSLIIKINDRHDDNSSIIEVSRKTAMLLKFYKKKITKVRVELLSDQSKQMKKVTESMSSPFFNDTIDSAPTISVSISNIEEPNISNKDRKNIKQPIEIGFENVDNNDLYLKIYNFKSYQDIKKIISNLNIPHKFTSENNGSSYNLIIGPLESVEANNLVLSFISKGYKKNEFILK